MKIEVKTNAIVKATPLFPNLMHECAESLLKADYEALVGKREELQKARALVNQLEEEVTLLSKLFEKESQVFDIQWGIEEREVLDSDTTQTGDVINRARERH